MSTGSASVLPPWERRRWRRPSEVERSLADYITIGPIPADDLPATDAGVEALIFADADGSHRTVLQLAIPTKR